MPPQPAIRLYLDEDLDPLITERLRTRGHDVVSALELGRVEIEDEDHLAYAAREGRVLLTFNTRHFAPLYAAWWREGRSHAGILVSRQCQRAEIGELLRLVENVLQLAAKEDLAIQLHYLSEFDV